MANKQLTAKVRLDSTQAEQKLKNISKQINAINRAVNKTKATNLEKQLSRCGTQATKLRTKIGKVNSALSKTVTSANKVSTAINKSVSKTNSISGKVRQWSNAQRQVTANAKATNSQYQKTGSLLGTIKGKLRGLADTYLGVMGMKAIIDTSDMITSAENKLNYTSAQALGTKGTNANGSYSTATLNATQDAMDKMYASSQKVRMGYGDMMNNVSKSMALAGDAFDNNTDKAIRFQEIMAEAYAVGGASAQEMSSSMYQLIQALGSGTLAGDELRSVREGAPLAYKAIEEFAQGVYNTTDSLKDMASQGMITSEMVVAAIMNEGKALDSAFAQTEQTFAQTWEQIKNVAVKAFAPVSKMLRTALNDAIDNNLIEKVTTVFSGIAKGIMIAFTVIKNAIVWIADNWNWLKYVIGAALIVIITLQLQSAFIAIWSAIKIALAWMWTHKVLIIIAIAIMLLIYVFDQFKNGAITACQAIFYALLIVAGAILLIGILTLNLTLIIIGAVLLVLAFIFKFFEQVCYGAGWLAAWIVNIVFAIVNFIITCVYLLLTLIWNIVTLIVNSVMAGAMFIGTIIQWIVAFIVNLVMGCGQSIVAISHNVVAAILNVSAGLLNSLCAVAQNIGIAFQNAWIWAKNTFWEFIADVLEGISKLEPVINGIAGLLGKDGVDFGGLAGAARSRKSEYKTFVSVSDAWSSGMNSVQYKDVGDAWSNGWNTMKFADMGEMVSSGWNTMDRAKYSDAWNKGMSTLNYVDANAWGSKAGNWGAGVKDTINNKLSKYQNGKTTGDILNNLFDGGLDKMGKKLGLDFGDLNNGFPSVNDPAYDLAKNLGDGLGGKDGNGGLDDIAKKVDDIADNTGSIADSMELTDEDLDYLRKIAEMEWKKEYTTANITVDMSNYNTINGESDLDGIVTKLADKLYEEMNVVANGVYAY